MNRTILSCMVVIVGVWAGYAVAEPTLSIDRTTVTAWFEVHEEGVGSVHVVEGAVLSVGQGVGWSYAAAPGSPFMAEVAAGSLGIRLRAESGPDDGFSMAYVETILQAWFGVVDENVPVTVAWDPADSVGYELWDETLDQGAQQVGIDSYLLLAGHDYKFTAHTEVGSVGGVVDCGETRLVHDAKLIPAPGAALLGGLGLAFVGWRQRRRQIG